MAEASSSSSSARTTVTNAKFEVEKFEVFDILCQQELDITLEEKPDNMDEKEWIKSIDRHVVLFTYVWLKIRSNLS